MSNRDAENFWDWAERRLKRAIEKGFVELYAPRGAKNRGSHDRPRPKKEWRVRKHSEGVRF